MAELREDELEIVMEDGEVLHKRILFTANYGATVSKSAWNSLQSARWQVCLSFW